MTLGTPLPLRWHRAQQIDLSAIQAPDNKYFNVPSQNGTADYDVQIEFDGSGKLVAATCSCPDFAKQVGSADAPMLRNVLVCKHILAAAQRAYELGLRMRKRRARPSSNEPGPATCHQRPPCACPTGIGVHDHWAASFLAP